MKKLLLFIFFLIALTSYGYALLPAPTNFNTTILNTTAINLSWTANESAEGYMIYKSIDSGSTYTNPANVTAPTINYLDEGLTTGSIYYYKINQYNLTAEDISSNTTADMGMPNTNPISGCQALSAETSYNLAKNISTTGSACLTADAANIVLNCNNFVINNALGTSAIYAGGTSAAINFTVYNCSIINMQNYAFRFANTQPQYVYGLTMSGASQTSFGALALGTGGGIIDGFSVTSTYSGTDPNYPVRYANNWQFKNGVVTASGITGIAVGSNSSYNNVSVTATRSTSKGIYAKINMPGASYISNSTIIVTGASAFALQATYGSVVIIDSTLNSTGNHIFNFELLGDNKTYNLTNVTENWDVADGEFNIAAGSTKKMYRNWYADVNAKNSTGSNLQGVTINITDVNGVNVYLGTTDVNGNIPQQILNSYWVNYTVAAGTSGAYNYLSNYTVTANITGQTTTTQSFNLTDNIQINLNMTEVPDNTCSYTSGNWVINSADNCNITTTYNLGGNNITFNGTGTTRINTTIYNWTSCTAQNGALVTVTQGGILG